MIRLLVHYDFIYLHVLAPLSLVSSIARMIIDAIMQTAHVLSPCACGNHFIIMINIGTAIVIRIIVVRKTLAILFFMASLLY